MDWARCQSERWCLNHWQEAFKCCLIADQSEGGEHWFFIVQPTNLRCDVCTGSLRNTWFMYKCNQVNYFNSSFCCWVFNVSDYLTRIQLPLCLVILLINRLIAHVLQLFNQEFCCTKLVLMQMWVKYSVHRITPGHMIVLFSTADWRFRSFTFTVKAWVEEGEVEITEWFEYILVCLFVEV